MTGGAILVTFSDTFYMIVGLFIGFAVTHMIHSKK